MKKLRILANISRYDYGNKSQGDSFEYSTFYTFFLQSGYSVDLFDYMESFKRGGKKLVHKELLTKVTENNYDLIFTVPLFDNFDPKTLEQLQKSASGAISVAWMCDDKWRWESFGKHYGPFFDYTITTDPDALQKYKSIGYSNAVLSQWAHDESVFKRLPLTKRYDVSFIGGISGWRSYVIKKLQQRGIKVECFGTGWKNGKVSVEEMVGIYNQSKIVLNLSNSTRFDFEYLLTTNKPRVTGNFKSDILHFLPGLTEFVFSKKRQEDIKARFFEVLGTGSFLLSYPVEHLEKYLTPGVDLVTYESVPDLIKRIKYYLNLDEEREKIASHGYTLVKTKHTYQNRFDEIFKRLTYYE